MKASKVSVIILSFFIIFMLIPMNQVSIPAVRASTMPTDADAWTENDNATYVWIADPAHPDETLSFTTSDKQVGSYAFNITHTDAWTRMRWFLNFTWTDLSSYDALEFWIKPKWFASEKAIFIYIENTRNSNPRFNVKFKVSNNTWTKVYVPLDAFFESVGSSSWTAKTLLHFYVSDNIGASDGTQVLLDGINFKTHTASTPTNSLDKTWLNNFYNVLPEYRESSNIVYDGNSYTTVHDWLNITSGAHMGGSLEVEALGQSIGALAYLYKETSAPIYLTKAKLYANWLLEFADVEGVGGGLVYEYNNATSTFDDKIGATINGWALWGLSVLYDITENSTYKTVLDNLFDCCVNDAWFWNSTEHCFDQYYDKVTGWDYASGSAFGMRTGAMMAGLGAYYRYVEANSTAESIVNDFYSNKVNDANNEFKMGSDFEQTMYNSWGFYECWQAFSNTTYRDEVVGEVAQFYHAYAEINSNASIARYPWFCDTSSYDYLDGWGGQCGLYLLMIDYETSPSTLKQKAFEKYVFDYINLAKGDAWLMEYHINDAGTADKSWSTGSLFICLGLTKYMKRFESEPYALASEAELTSHIFSGDVLTLVLDGSGTTTTEVYCSGKGTPKTVTGADSWTFNDGVVTLTLTHASSKVVQVSWGGQASGTYKLTVYVKKDGQPVQFVEVKVRGHEPVKTGLFGSVDFELQSDTYRVEVTVDGQTQNKTVNLHKDSSVGFEFWTVLPQAPRDLSGAMTILVIAVVAGVLVFFGSPILAFRRRKG